MGARLGRLQKAWTEPPVIDHDPGIVNYVGHPYVGAQYYLTQRNYDESPLRSFLCSVVMSTGFEYLVESWSEQTQHPGSYCDAGRGINSGRTDLLGH